MEGIPRLAERESAGRLSRRRYSCDGGARGFKSTSDGSQEAGARELARQGVEESRSFERAGYDHVATVAISGVTGRRVWHPPISQEISSLSSWRQQVTTLTSPAQRCSSRSRHIETGFPPPKAVRSMRLIGELLMEQTEPDYFDELLGILTEERIDPVSPPLQESR